MTSKMPHPYRKILDFLKPYEQFSEDKVQKDMAMGFRFNKKDCRIILKELSKLGHISREKNRIKLNTVL